MDILLARKESELIMKGLIDDVRLSKDEFFESLSKSGLTQTALANLAKVSKQTVNNYGTKTSKAIEIYLSMILSMYVNLCLVKEKS